MSLVELKGRLTDLTKTINDRMKLFYEDLEPYTSTIPQSEEDAIAEQEVRRVFGEEYNQLGAEQTQLMAEIRAYIESNNLLQSIIALKELGYI